MFLILLLAALVDPPDGVAVNCGPAVSLELSKRTFSTSAEIDVVLRTDDIIFLDPTRPLNLSIVADWNHCYSYWAAPVDECPGSEDPYMVTPGQSVSLNTGRFSPTASLGTAFLAEVLSSMSDDEVADAPHVDASANSIKECVFRFRLEYSYEPWHRGQRPARMCRVLSDQFYVIPPDVAGD